MNLKEEAQGAPAQPEDVFSSPASADLINLDQILQSTARMQEELAYAKDARREERFYWICFCLFVLDIIFFKFLESLPGFLIFFVVQLFILAPLAKRMGVDWASEALDRCAEWAAKQKG